MRLDDGVADLHMHTTASDGTSTVDERVEQARERGIEAIAVTDHDRIADDFEGRVERRGDVELITGVEVRADCLGTKVEVLGYFVEPSNPELEAVLSTARRYRRERNRGMVERLAAATGLDLDYDALASSVDGGLGRPHLADRLVEAGVVDSIGAAFDEYLGTDGEAYVPMERVDHERVVEAIHAAEGIASLAHPGRIRSDRVPELVERLVDAGLDGIEVRYPYGGSGPDAYADVGVEGAAELAEEYDLIETGGSDCHGLDSGKFRIGEVRVTAEVYDALRAAAGVDVDERD
jgi:hypothetical protein